MPGTDHEVLYNVADLTKEREPESENELYPPGYDEQENSTFFIQEQVDAQIAAGNKCI